MELEETMNRKFNTYGIAINSSYRNNEEEEPMDVVEIRLVLNNEEFETAYVPYSLSSSGEVTLNDMFV